MEILIWCAAAALATGTIVFAIVSRGRRGLQVQLAAAQSAAAVAEARLADLTVSQATLSEAHRKLGDEHLAVSGQKERLSTAVAKLEQELQREAATAVALRESLEKSSALNVQLDSRCRVALAQNESLTARVGQLDDAIRAGTEENRRQGEVIAQLTAGSAALEQARSDLLVRLAEQKTWVEEQTRFFEQKIAGVATQLLDEKSRAFTEVNKKEIDAVVAPFKEQLKEFRERVDHIYVADSRERGQLHEQIRQLTELNQLVSKQAEDLTKALTISSRATGDWGEMILQRILEESGLREGKEYVLQHTVEGADEDLQRPDAVILLPDGKHVVLDSKVSNKAWKEYCAATDEETREAKLGEHLASVRAHMRELASRDYQHSPDLKTIEFVLMFVPIEAALLTALSRDESLFTEAWRAKVYLVSPGMLMASLKLIEGMWVYQRRKESADKIAEAGRKLYDKLTIFSNTFVDVGAAIEKAHGTFEKAQGQLVSGKGSAIKLAAKLKELGVSPGPGKVMAPELVALADAEDDDAELTALPAADGIGEQRSSGDAG
jgi:DNA recombination protein RmuC